MSTDVTGNELKNLLASGDPEFWLVLAEKTLQANQFNELVFLSTLRRKALAQGLKPQQHGEIIKVALIGGYTMYPLSELIAHILSSSGYDITLWSGEYDNYISELIDETSSLYEYDPSVVILLPPHRRYSYTGNLLDSRESVEAQISQYRDELLSLCSTVHERNGCHVILGNFIPSTYHDPGAFRERTLACDWNFFKLLNMQLGLQAPDYVSICNLEFLSFRHGGLQARDNRGWYESKQAFSADFLCAVAKELCHVVDILYKPTKKVLVMDLDHTLWGGVIGEDGLEGIDLGGHSALGECYKDFQRSIRELQKRGILLAVCSKNDEEIAMAPFLKHPEMVLRMDDIVAFKANWRSKAENLSQIANDLNLGLDSFVFVDDTLAEIELVRQFLPEVTTLWLGADPAEYVQVLKDSRLFEPRQLTLEDGVRVEQYKQDKHRATLLVSAGDMNAYLSSLKMKASVCEFRTIDIPRISQLINKTNQFNLTTLRMTEAEVSRAMESDRICLALRLTDKFGELGLVAVIIALPINDTEIEIENWLMSCRVLERGVEKVLINELVRLSKARGFSVLVGRYLPSGKNRMVEGLYERVGFRLVDASIDGREYRLVMDQYEPIATAISVSCSV